MKNFILNLLFPPQCVNCGTQNSWLCNFCSSLIKPLKSQKCYRCGKDSETGKTCRQHFNHQPDRTLDGLLVAAQYNSNPVLKKSIKALKYHKRTTDIPQKLALLINNTLALGCFPFALRILPVPLHPSRLKQRGFNQSELLAKALKKLNQDNRLLTIDHRLSRTKATPAQAQIPSRQERIQNLKDAFSVLNKPDPNHCYLLVDDVCSSGTTLEECCKTLRKQGAEKVWGLVLARNQR